MSGFLNFYKNGNLIIKILFFGIVVLMGGLWLIGSLTKFDRLVMFVVGAIIGGALINIFLYDYVAQALAYISNVLSSV